MLPESWIHLTMLLPAFFLVFTRISGIMITSPILGSTVVPAKLKIGLVLAISATTFPSIAPMLPQDVTLSAAVAGMAGELMIGLIIGIGLSIILLATQMAGMVVGQQAGLALATAFDPSTQTRSSVIGQVYFFTATAIFLIIGGHRAMIQAVLDSFEAVPVMTFRMEPVYVNLVSELLMSSLKMAMKLAGPAVISLLIAKASMGFLGRTIPQLHILSVGFAVFVCIGMFLSSLTIGSLYDILSVYIFDGFEMIRFAFGME